MKTRNAIAVGVASLFVWVGVCMAQPIDRNTFIGINKKVAPSVVSIQVRTSGAKRKLGDTHKSGGTASGFLIEDSRVITNHHVIEDATDITVTLHDGRLLAARVLGSDPTVDLAVLKLEGDTWNDSLVPAKLGNSSALEVGSLVVAIGNPLNIGISMSLGIVSAIGRTLEDILVPLYLIQTDAAINHGNSGGPLVNIDGEVIGVNVAKISDKIASGISFAIPIDYVKDIVETLSKGEKIGNGWIGAEVTRPVDEDPELWKLPQEEGVIVTKIFPASPAQRAGLKRNDYITEINRKPVLTSRDFKWIIQNARLQVNLTVWRMGTQMQIAVSVEQEPEKSKQSPMPSGHTHP